MTKAAINETRLWEWLKGAEKYVVGRELHMERIENLVGVGNADVSGCICERYFDIELKTADRPARPTTTLLKDGYVRAAQKVWHMRRWLAGGNNFVLLQVASGADASRYLLPGLYIRDLEGKTEHQLARMSVLHNGGSSAYDIVRRAVSYRSTLARESQGYTKKG